MLPPPLDAGSPGWRMDHFVARGGSKRTRRRPRALMGAPWSPCRGDHNPYSKLPLRCPIRRAPGAPSCPSRGWTSARHRLAFIEFYFFISPPARHEIAPPALGVWGTSEEAVSADYGRLDTATKGRPSVHAADERGPRGFMHPPLTHSPPWRPNLHRKKARVEMRFSLNWPLAASRRQQHIAG